MKKQTNKLYYFLFSLIIFLVLSQLFLSNGLIMEGKKLEKIQQETEFLEEENNYLKTQSASLFSLSELTEIAKDKGFVKPSSVINLSDKLPVAVSTR